MSELKVSVFGFRLAKEDIKGRGIKKQVIINCFTLNKDRSDKDRSDLCRYGISAFDQSNLKSSVHGFTWV